MAQLGALDGVPQLSYYSSAPELSCDVQYTHFGRSYVSDKISSSVLAEQLAGYGWTPPRPLPTRTRTHTHTHHTTPHHRHRRPPAASSPASRAAQVAALWRAARAG